jgi:hypothetical protein
MPRSSSQPITSPVERISGERRDRGAGEAAEREDGLLDGPVGRTDLAGEAEVLELGAQHAERGELGEGTPMAFDTNGIVREARGLTSSMNTTPSLIANWMFIRPTTLSALRQGVGDAADLVDERRREACAGGRTMPASPEWTPACSTCSEHAADHAWSRRRRSRRRRASMASSRNWSSKHRACRGDVARPRGTYGA